MRAEPAVNEMSCHQRNGQLELSKRNNRISDGLITKRALTMKRLSVESVID